jgi:hypothetical protein
LRRAEQSGSNTPEPESASTVAAVVDSVRTSSAVASAPSPVSLSGGLVLGPDFLSRVARVPWAPSPDSHLIDMSKPHEAPAEEFRTLRTRLNHLQTLQPIQTIVVTSPSPAEGKSFAAVNLALAEAQLDGNPTLLIDCDFRRPIVHNLFQVERSPGLTDYLTGKAELEDCIKRVGNTHLYILSAGEAVINPLELLNLREMKVLLDAVVRRGCEPVVDTLFRNRAGRPHWNDNDRFRDARHELAVREQCAWHYREWSPSW